MELGLSGLASGFDWRTLVDQLADVERVPQRRLVAEQNVLEQRSNAYSSITTQLNVLQNKVSALKDPSLFSARLTSVGDAAVASASASAGAALGTYTFAFTQLATASRQQGTANLGSALHTSNDVSALVLSSASFSSPVTAGTFTVNGQQITLATTDTLQAVFDQISTATGGTVSGSYDNATDKISLTSASPIVLGSATDTSNFLMAAKLYNNGTGTTTSASALGTIKRTSALTDGNFAVAVSDGGAGAGAFKINGVSIAFNVATDSLQNVLDRINASAAGVSASFDSVSDRMLLTNKTTGDTGLALEDVTGNFLQATGLSGGALERGNNLLYTINGGGPLVSQSNSITEASSGLTGLSVTALAAGSSTTVTVASDSSKIKQAITDFITEYNGAQSLIDAQTASSTDANGKVTAGLLAGERDADEIARKLRGMANASLTSLSGSIRSLADLGIHSNGDNDKLTLSGTQLDEALANNLAGVEQLFLNSTDGLSLSLHTYVESLAGEEGSLLTKQDTLTKSAAGIDTQIADLERVIQSNRDAMILRFVAMETAQAKINQQLSFLMQKFGEN